jgi:uncharacterized protein with FMN-binding domain
MMLFMAGVSLPCAAAQPVNSGSASAPAAPLTRTKAEVEALIQKAGATPPDWWDATPLNFPKTLDLGMNPPPPKSGWDPSKNVGQFFWSVINENSSKWKEGVKFAAHLMTVNQSNPDKVKQAMQQTAHLYQHCLCDYARAAYWWLKRGDTDSEELALCYWKLGNKQMAVDVLKNCGDDDSRHGTIIKLWADMGEFDIAMKHVQTKAENDKADIAYLMAGEACRGVGKYTEALDWYQKVLKVEQAKAGRDFKQSQARAQASIEAIKLYDTLDLKRVPDGAYKSNSTGYSGQVNVEVTVKSGKISDCKVTQHSEKQYYGSLSETPKQIISKQGVKGIDTYSSATITSEAIINASAKALSAGMK